MFYAAYLPAVLTSSLTLQLRSHVLGQILMLYKLRVGMHFPKLSLLSLAVVRLHRLSKTLDGLRPGVSRSSPRLKGET